MERVTEGDCDRELEGGVVGGEREVFGMEVVGPYRVDVVLGAYAVKGDVIHLQVRLCFGMLGGGVSYIVRYARVMLLPAEGYLSAFLHTKGSIARVKIRLVARTSHHGDHIVCAWKE